MTTITTATVASKVDNYISLKKQVDALEKQMEKAKTEMIALGVGQHDGTRGCVKVNEIAGRKVIDWAKVQTLVIIPQKILDQCTSHGAASTRITLGAL